jgi:[ribosomal protein S5]-alanine N-acetyltransferase
MLCLSTPRLNLVALTDSHLRLALANSAQLQEELGCILDDEAISDASRRAIHVKLEKMGQAPEITHPWYTYWLLVIRENKIGVGMVGFKGAPDSVGEVEIGYGISPRFQAHGYMTEAVRGLVGWAFRQPECHSVRAETLRTNVQSHRVLQKSEFLAVRETQLEIFWRVLRNPVEQPTVQDETPSLSEEK